MPLEKKSVEAKKLLVQIRKDNNLTQSDIATALGVSVQAISKWENDVNVIPRDRRADFAKAYKPSPQQIEALNQFLNVSPEALRPDLEQFLIELSAGNSKPRSFFVLSVSAVGFQTGHSGTVYDAVETCAKSGLPVLFYAQPPASNHPRLKRNALVRLREDIAFLKETKGVKDDNIPGNILGFDGTDLGDAQPRYWKLQAALSKFLFVLAIKEWSSDDEVSWPTDYELHDAWIHFDFDDGYHESKWKPIEISSDMSIEVRRLLNNISQNFSRLKPISHFQEPS